MPQPRPRKTFFILTLLVIILLLITGVQWAVLTSRAPRASLTSRAPPPLQPKSPQLQLPPAATTLPPPTISPPCNALPFFTSARIASMTSTAAGRAWEQSYPSWDKWMNFLSGHDELHMRDNPNGRDHFLLLAALLDAAPEGLNPLVLRNLKPPTSFVSFALPLQAAPDYSLTLVPTRAVSRALLLSEALHPSVLKLWHATPCT
jgi:hypothetical protein